MEKIKDVKSFMRIMHRYIGFLMAGIMTVYAISGVILIYRDTNIFKKENHYEKVIDKNLNEKQLSKELKIKNFEITEVKKGLVIFKEGTYNPLTGEADYKKMELPYVWDKMANLHLAKSADTLSPLNAFFGICLLFFVISSFWMFPPKSKIFKKGIILAVVGLILSLLLTFL